MAIERTKEYEVSLLSKMLASGTTCYEKTQLSKPQDMCLPETVSWVNSTKLYSGGIHLTNETSSLTWGRRSFGSKQTYKLWP